MAYVSANILSITGINWLIDWLINWYINLLHIFLDSMDFFSMQTLKVKAILNTLKTMGTVRPVSIKTLTQIRIFWAYVTGHCTLHHFSSSIAKYVSLLELNIRIRGLEICIRNVTKKHYVLGWLPDHYFWKMRGSVVFSFNESFSEFGGGQKGHPPYQFFLYNF